MNVLSPYPTLNRGSSILGTFPSAAYTGNLAIWAYFILLITFVLGQSKDNEFLLSLWPLGIKMYDPVIASTIPWPPDVPGKNACKTAVDSVKILSMNIGLPARSTVTRGMFLSYSRMWVITSSSNLPNSRLKFSFCFWGMYGFVPSAYKQPSDDRIVAFAQ